MKKLLSAAALLIIAALLGFTLMPKNQTAPTFAAHNLQGEAVSNAQLNGKVTLINFWFPSCPGCVSEMPKLIKMAGDYQGKDFQIIGIATPVDPLSSVEEYVATRKIPFQIVFDEQKTITPLFVKTELFPTSVLINKKGEILKTFVGEPNFDELYQEVDAELAK